MTFPGISCLPGNKAWQDLGNVHMSRRRNVECVWKQANRINESHLSMTRKYVSLPDKSPLLAADWEFGQSSCAGIVFKTSSCNNRNYRMVSRDALMLRNSCLWDRHPLASDSELYGALWMERGGFYQVSFRHGSCLHDYVYMAHLKSYYSHWSLSDL